MTKVAYDHQIFSLQQFGGISRYVCEIASRVSKAPGWRSLVVAPVHYNDYLADSGISTLGLHLRMRVPRSGRLYRAVNTLTGPPLLWAVGADIVHRTYYSAARRPARGRVVVTVYDMIHELFPESFPASDCTREHKRFSVEAADHVICISHNTAADLTRLLGVPPSKISVTHLGFSAAFADATAAGPDVRDRPYLLYVGHRAGYKNFARVLEAYGASSRLSRDFELVTFGGSPFNADELARIDRVQSTGGRVVRLTGSDLDLARAYRGARALVYPSLYEGFGIPPLEAMSCGCAVACSFASSLPEVVGNAALLFDPVSVDSIRIALETVCFEDCVRTELLAAGKERVGQFSWDRCAAGTLEAYRRALTA